MYERKVHEALEINKFRTLNKMIGHSKFSGRTPKRLLANVLRLVIKEDCDKDLTHSLDPPKNISLKIVPQVVICDMCGT